MAKIPFNGNENRRDAGLSSCKTCIGMDRGGSVELTTDLGVRAVAMAGWGQVH